MQLVSKTLKSDFDCALWGDDQEGSKLKAQEKVNHAIDWVMSGKDRHFIHMGDALEAITVDDKRYYKHDQDEPIPLVQAQNVIAQYKKASKKCLLWLMGNHELKLWRFGDITRDILCPQMNVTYGGYSSNLAFYDKHGSMFKWHLRHGIGTGLMSNAKDEEQRTANMKATLKMRLKRKAGDCVLMAAGCTHKLLVVPPVRTLYLTDDGVDLQQHYRGAASNEPYIHPDDRWYVNTGTFRKSIGLDFVNYTELKGYDPLPLGYVIAEVRDRKIANVREVEV